MIKINNNIIDKQITNEIKIRREPAPSDVYQTPFIIYISGTTIIGFIKISITIVSLRLMVTAKRYI